MKELLQLNKDVGKDILLYYKGKYNKFNLTDFITLPFIYQLGFLIDYFENKHNIGILVDLTNIIIFYVNPNLNANEIINNYNKTDIWTDRIHMENNIKPTTIIDNYHKAFFIILDKILIPF